MSDNKLFGISIESQTQDTILDKIEKVLSSNRDFYHIVSLNPENLVAAHESHEYMQIVKSAQIKIVDGVGVALTGRLTGLDVGQRVTGVDLMQRLIELADKRSLRVVFIGGKANLADKLVDCYKHKFPSAKFIGIQGIKDINNPQKEEEERIFSIVREFKPHILFAAFGSPAQEIWLWRNRTILKGVICMGVGGAFDFLAGRVLRAPKLIRIIGFEWLFRLFVQPWRLRRQLKLIKFCWLVLSVIARNAVTRQSQ